ncbi:MAG: HAMP domain-containing sensor histidine kinase [Actinomycetota bacterium]
MSRLSFPPKFGLKQRMVLFFGLAALAAAIALSVVTYASTRSYLLGQRSEVAQRQAFNNAQLMRNVVETDASNVAELVTQIRTEQGGYAVIQIDAGPGKTALFYAQEPLRFTQSNLPTELLNLTLSNKTGRQRFEFENRPYEAIGVAIPSVGLHYFEAFPVTDVQNTLRTIQLTLLIGVVLITFAAGVLGFSMSKNVLQPLTRVALAANKIATGGLDTRLAHEEDSDLERLVASFNEMANAVQQRIEREQRFASDVSHELRSPVTALSAAADVLVSRRSEFTERNQQAIDIMKKQIERFDRTVIDLLELSRLDAHAAEHEIENIQLNDLIGRIMHRYGFGEIPFISTVQSSDGEMQADDETRLDRRRIERILVNLLENARDHANGATRVTLTSDGEAFTLAVHDAGPGVAISEQLHIFDRFARGTASRNGKGSGLGLAIVSEHAHALHGSVHVEQSHEGGSSFVISFPKNLSEA